MLNVDVATTYSGKPMSIAYYTYVQLETPVSQLARYIILRISI